MQFHGEIVGDLSAYRYDDTVGRFEIDDIEHAFERKLVEVKSVAHIVVGRYRFGVIVDHNRFITQFACRLYRIDRAPVKLYRASYAVSARTEHDDRTVVFVIRYVMVAAVVSEIEVVGEVGVFRSNGIDAFYRRKYAHFLAKVTHTYAFRFEVTGGIFDEAGNLEVGESQPFGFGEDFLRNIFDMVVAFEFKLEIMYVL